MSYSSTIKIKIFFICAILMLVARIAFGNDTSGYDAKGKRDPFVPLISEAGSSYASDADAVSNIGDIRLEGIVWDDVLGSVAIINGEIIKEGQGIGSVKVLKIEKDGVIFNAGGETIKVKLNDE